MHASNNAARPRMGLHGQVHAQKSMKTIIWHVMSCRKIRGRHVHNVMYHDIPTITSFGAGTDAANPRRSARLLNTSKVNYQDVDPEVEDSLPSLAARMEDVDVSSGGWYYPGEMSSQGSQWGPESSMQPYRIAEGVLYNGCPVVSGVALFPFDRGHNTRGTPEQGLPPILMHAFLAYSRA